MAAQPSQLAGIASLDVTRQLERSARTLSLRAGTRPRPIVASVHLSEPSRGVVEACAVVNTGGRWRAIALRLERLEETWRCTALHVG